MQDDKVQMTEQPNQQRRRFTKGGLAAPVVLATLASKPVLGASFSYHCTVSGKLSGNTSSHGSDTCVVSGVKTADQWKALPPVGNWPSQAINNAGTGARAFRNTPNGATPTFSDERRSGYRSESQLAQSCIGQGSGGGHVECA